MLYRSRASPRRFAPFLVRVVSVKGFAQALRAMRKHIVHECELKKVVFAGWTVTCATCATNQDKPKPNQSYSYCIRTSDTVVHNKPLHINHPAGLAWWRRVRSVRLARGELLVNRRLSERLNGLHSRRPHHSRDISASTCSRHPPVSPLQWPLNTTVLMATSLLVAYLHL